MKHGNYKIRDEFKKYENTTVPFHPVLLRIINAAMPVIQKADSPYEKKLTIERMDFKTFSAELIYPRGKTDLPCMVYFHLCRVL